MLKKELLATQAGIIFPELDKYYLFKAPYHMGQPGASIFEHGKGKPVLYTDGIEICVGIGLRTSHSYALLHPMGITNTDVLLKAVIGKHLELGIPLENVQASMRTDNMREMYERITRDNFASLGIDVELHQTGYFPLPNHLNSGNQLRRYSLTVG